MTKVLIIEDEKSLQESVARFLTHEGFKVIVADNGLEALKSVRDNQPEIVVMDVMIPELNGIQLCQILRQESDIPIIMVTAMGDEQDILNGLGKGADDYLVKPVRLRELAARIQAVLRRKSATSNIPKIIRYGELVIDLDKVCSYKNGTELGLTATEFRLLTMMAQQPGRAFTRLQLLEGAIGESYENYERTIDTHIFNLRRKLEAQTGKPRYIQTVFGVGYRFGDLS